LKEENPEKAKAHFNLWQKCLDANKVENIPDLFDKVVSSIRKDCTRTKSTQKKFTKPIRKGDIIENNGKTYERKQKLSKAQKRVIVQERINVAAQKARDANQNEANDDDE